jgi:hypothetical protein
VRILSAAFTGGLPCIASVQHSLQFKGVFEFQFFDRVICRRMFSSVILLIWISIGSYGIVPIRISWL